mmetsp:Transcript_366/g.830  ORF Transcript_366/g.830 Transcript_366/m.830 type:complete len:330 (-) Transcript_366:1289-2278(-)
MADNVLDVCVCVCVCVCVRPCVCVLYGCNVCCVWVGGYAVHAWDCVRASECLCACVHVPVHACVCVRLRAWVPVCVEGECGWVGVCVDVSKSPEIQQCFLASSCNSRCRPTGMAGLLGWDQSWSRTSLHVLMPHALSCSIGRTLAFAFWRPMVDPASRWAVMNRPISPASSSAEYAVCDAALMVGARAAPAADGGRAAALGAAAGGRPRHGVWCTTYRPPGCACCGCTNAPDAASSRNTAAAGTPCTRAIRSSSRQGGPRASKVCHAPPPGALRRTVDGAPSAAPLPPSPRSPFLWNVMWACRGSSMCLWNASHRTRSRGGRSRQLTSL